MKIRRLKLLNHAAIFGLGISLAVENKDQVFVKLDSCPNPHVPESFPLREVPEYETVLLSGTRQGHSMNDCDSDGIIICWQDFSDLQIPKFEKLSIL